MIPVSTSILEYNFVSRHLSNKHQNLHGVGTTTYIIGSFHSEGVVREDSQREAAETCSVLLACWWWCAYMTVRNMLLFFPPHTYMVHAQMAGIGLRPLLDHHPLQFDITVHGQNRVVKFQVCTCNRLTFSFCKLWCHGGGGLKCKRHYIIGPTKVWIRSIKKATSKTVPLQTS